jgi:catechol-2,3-dioxygenase
MILDYLVEGSTNWRPEMPIQRLNHAVLYVRDVSKSVAFYGGLLGFQIQMEVPGRAAFLLAPGSENDHDLGLFQIGDAARPSDAGRSSVGLYHLAWEVDTLAELKRIRGILVDAGALVGESDHSTTKALYARDPDGLEFEVCWIVPAELLTEDVIEGRVGILPLDIDGEIARYGAETLGLLSAPAAARI